MVNKYFLAANSADGFFSVFGECFDALDDWRAYIIKGGPGTGKSSFMKKAASAAEKRGIPYELCPCSSDPDSLDAVIFPTFKTVILDGTAPHTVDPKFPAICEEIINMGQFWQRDIICKNKKEIFALCKDNAVFHNTAKANIRVIGMVLKNNFSTLLAATDIEKCTMFSVNLAEKYLPQKNTAGKKWVRFLSGITPKGEIYYFDTVNSFKNKIIISDPYGAATSIILSELTDMAVARGYEVITIKNHVLASDCIDALIIPELSLCIAREYGNVKFENNIRRIHYTRFTDMDEINKNRQKIQFGKKLTARLTTAAVENLKNAKHIHDKLEKYYIDAMDFDKMNLFTDKFIDNLF